MNPYYTKNTVHKSGWQKSAMWIKNSYDKDKIGTVFSFTHSQKKRKLSKNERQIFPKHKITNKEVMKKCNFIRPDCIIIYCQLKSKNLLHGMVYFYTKSEQV